MGRPMGSGRSAVRHSVSVVQTVYSEGPYALKKRTRESDGWATSGGHASPATTTQRRAGSDRSGSVASADGGSVTWVIDASFKRSVSAAPARTVFGGGTQSVAPASRAIITSETDASKLGEANWRTRLSGPTPKARICAAARLGIPAW